MLATSRSRVDRCPGALSLHAAADGLLARVRLPGGRITAAQLQGLAALTDLLEITSRANIQLRGVTPSVAGAVAELGLLPSATHERVRNIAAHPAPEFDATVTDLDQRLQARPALAALPGRFLFAVGAHPDADVVLAGPQVHAGGRAVTTSDPVGTALEVAERFLEARTTHWRIAELDVPVLDAARAARPPLRPLPAALTPPLGRLTAAMVADLHGTVVLTAERTVVLREPHPPLDWDAPTWAGVTACAGAPRCASGRLDTAAEASRQLGRGRVHVVGCDHGCGRPTGPHTLVAP